MEICKYNHLLRQQITKHINTRFLSHGCYREMHCSCVKRTGVNVPSASLKLYMQVENCNGLHCLLRMVPHFNMSRKGLSMHIPHLFVCVKCKYRSFAQLCHSLKRQNMFI